MSKVKITNAFTSRAKCDKSKPKEVYSDAELSGFSLYVRQTGNKTFHYSYSKDSKRTMQS